MPPDPAVPAIGYVRVSMMREDAVSPELQKSAITASADRDGRRIVRWITDLDATGRDFRRKVMAGIAAIEAGEAAEIRVFRYDRWGRNAVGALANIRRVELAGGSVISATEPLDPETAVGRYTRTNALALAEMQSDILGEGWRAALSRRVRLGLPATGTPRFGYARLGRIPDEHRPHSYRRDRADPDGERYVPDPVTGPVLASLYERFSRGEGTTRLLAYLNGLAIPTVRGGTWTIQTLIHVLDSGFAAGLLRIHDPRCGCSQRGRCRKVTYVPGAHEPVITMEQWEAYMERRKRLRDVPPRSRTPAYPLTGLVVCGGCGGPLVACHAMGQRGFAYRCNRWVQHRGCPGVWARRALVEQMVLDRLALWAGDIEARLRAERSRAAVVTDAEAARARLGADLARADRELRNLVRQRASDPGIPGEVYDAVRDELLAARTAALEALARAEAAREANSGDYVPVARRLLATWQAIPPATRRDLLGSLIARVVVTRTGYRTPAKIEVIAVWEQQGTE